jgi:threonyl-tRNA synthetase
MLVVGDREAEKGQVSVRNRRHADQGAQSVEDFLAMAKGLIDARTPFE